MLDVYTRTDKMCSVKKMTTAKTWVSRNLYM